MHPLWYVLLILAGVLVVLIDVMDRE